MKVTLLLCLVLTGSYAVNQETFRGRLNPQGTQTVENLMRDMIRKVNDLIKQYSRVQNMQIGPVTVNNFNVRTLDTANVNIIMDRNRLGVNMERGRVHLTARLTARLLFIAVSGQIDAYGDDIRATLDSGVGVRSGKLYSQGMGCNLHVGRPRVDLHLPVINFLANQILNGLMPPITRAVCDGIKKYGNGMVNSVFQTLPTNINVFNVFRLDFPIRNFRSWQRHMVAGVGMEVRPVNNRAVSYANIRRLPIPEAEDGHMACGSISDFVVNTASRTFLPVGKTFDINIGSILSLFFKTIFPAKLFLRGTITQSPLFLVEAKEMIFSVKASGKLLDKDGNDIPNTETQPLEVRVTAPNNETPMFKSVVVQLNGPIKITLNLNLANVIDYIIKTIDTLFKGKGKVEQLLAKRATGNDLTRALNEMFFSRYFSGFNMKLSARHGALIACVSGRPTSTSTNIVYNALRRSFSG